MQLTYLYYVTALCQYLQLKKVQLNIFANEMCVIRYMMSTDVTYKFQ